jgi:hypothetical protein
MGSGALEHPVIIPGASVAAAAARILVFANFLRFI